jgi:glycolate oxidase
MGKWNATLPAALDDLYDLAVRLGGRVSGEHGIGHKRKAAMPRFVSPEYLTLCRTIKRALDPNHILNPGKIFDLE